MFTNSREFRKVITKHCVLFYLTHQHHLQLDDLASISLSILSHILLICSSYISATSLNPLLLVSEMFVVVVVVDFVLACLQNRFKPVYSLD